MIKKVISGGQTGGDRAGLIAAQLCNIPTGGTAPKKFRTLVGNDYDLRDIFGLVEHPEWSYPPRTECNVKDSDGTLRIARFFGSAGENCTLRFIDKHRKPSFDVFIDEPPPVAEVVAWIIDNKIEVLNVAGNSEQTAPGIQDLAVKFLIQVFRELRKTTGG